MSSPHQVNKSLKKHSVPSGDVNRFQERQLEEVRPSKPPKLFGVAVLTWLSAASLCCGLFGCGSLHTADRPWSEGWRTARIIEIDRKPDFSQLPATDCRRYFRGKSDERMHFALIEHRLARHHRTMIVVLDPNDSLREGDYVYANVDDCSKPAERFREPSP